MALDTPIFYQTTPAAIVNEAIDLLGEYGKIVGDITDGTQVAEAARRNYGQALRQLLRTAHWDFARKRATLQLLADATGATPLVSTIVESPWNYAYAWPIDGVMGRWLPWTPSSGGPVSGTGVPLTTAQSTAPIYPVLQPARFLVSSSEQYPVEVGFTPWTQLPDLRRTFGVGPIARRVILTDCAPPVEFVYTRFVPVIEEWDGLFRRCMALMMALIIAPHAIDDPKLRLPTMDRLTKTLQVAVADARVANGNESGMPQTVDHQPAWITARSRGWFGASPGADGSIFSGYSFVPADSSMQWSGSVF